ncbi:MULTISPECIES: HAMP domain-containing sensor histidine kinase [Halorussus]|uniref:sensor histidine kinase n=1 Tax=Halorussus TaxID=1070314 RepID=UPI000E20FAE9|nr:MULTISPECIES: PAS domain-containing sensor histidine kinase [Halorussus]NHN60724.1 PAS domain-containing protein [Halorussus sp. JP-T4]
MIHQDDGPDAVLAVDGDRGRRDAAVDALDDAGFRARSAETCEAARSALADRRYDCVVTCAELADGDYRDVLAAAEAADPSVPVVVRSDGVGAAEALDAGAADRVGTSETADLVARVCRVVDDRRSRRELERDSSMLNSFLASIPISVYFKDERGRHVRVSDSITGSDVDRPITNEEGKVHRSAEDVLGKTDFDLYRTGSAVEATADERHVMETESPILDKIESYAVAGLDTAAEHGWHGYSSTSKAPWYDADGELAGTVGITLDITERKKYEQRLERQNERLEQFASLLSHGLRYPLTVARGNLDLVAGDADRERLDAVDGSLDRIEKLVEDILDLVRYGSTVDDVADVDLETVATAAWEAVDAADAMALDVDSTAPISADRPRLRRLLEDLFRNARDHAGPDATVSVGATPTGFYVADDGPGIPPDRRDRVFDRGFSTGDGGRGFGLTIVRQIAAAHDWGVSVDEDDAGGARFEFVCAGIADLA